jgi:hypothetical protein
MPSSSPLKNVSLTRGTGPRTPFKRTLDMSNLQHPTGPQSTVNVIDTGMQQAILTEMRFLRDAVTEVKTTVASYPALIERQATTEQRQQETENRFADALVKVEQSIIRIHDRMDEVRDIVQKDMIDVKEDFRTFRDEHRKEVSTLIEATTGNLSAHISDLSKKVSDVKSETESWVNKGKGAWFVASILWGVIQLAIVAMMGWFFTEVRGLHDWKIITEHKFEEIDRRHGGEDSVRPPAPNVLPPAKK